VQFRTATRADLPAIIGLLADDVLGKTRDFDVVDDYYERAFAAIDADPRNFLVVADDDGEVVACMQITYIPGLGPTVPSGARSRRSGSARTGAVRASAARLRRGR